MGKLYLCRGENHTHFVHPNYLDFFLKWGYKCEPLEEKPEERGDSVVGGSGDG